MIIIAISMHQSLTKKWNKTTNRTEADKLVYVTKNKTKAYIIACKTINKAEEKQKTGYCYWTKKKVETECKLYLTKNKAEVELIIYFTSNKAETTNLNQSILFLFLRFSELIIIEIK